MTARNTCMRLEMLCIRCVNVLHAQQYMAWLLIRNTGWKLSTSSRRQEQPHRGRWRRWWGRGWRSTLLGAKTVDCTSALHRTRSAATRPTSNWPSSSRQNRRRRSCWMAWEVERWRSAGTSSSTEILRWPPLSLSSATTLVSFAVNAKSLSVLWKV